MWVQGRGHDQLVMSVGVEGDVVVLEGRLLPPLSS